MKVVLVRHAKAGKPNAKKYPDDSLRPLTKQGTKKLKKAAAGLGNIVTPDVVLTSPLTRTQQTASILERDAGWPPAVASEALDEKHSPADVIKAISKLEGSPKTVGIVGHGPNLQALTSHLTGVDAEKFDKGGAVSIRTKRSMKPGEGTVEWAMRRKELKQHA